MGCLGDGQAAMLNAWDMQTVWNEGCRGLERKQQDRSPKRIYHHDACKPMRKQKRWQRMMVG